MAPTRNDLIEEQILQIETDRALHSVGCPQLVEAAGSQRPLGVGFLRKRYLISRPNSMNSWETRFFRRFWMKNPDAPQLWLENLRNACNRSEYCHPKLFQVRVDLGWILYCNWCNLNELLTGPCCFTLFFLVGKNLRTWSHKKERSGWFQSPPIWERWCLWGLVGCPAQAGPFHSTYSLQKRVADIFFFFL